MSLKQLLFGLTLIAILTSCYRIPIPQGNILTDQEVNKISQGMTSEEVIKLLGSPVLENTFSNNQITYVYTFKKIRKPSVIKRLIIYLQNNHVVRVSFDKNLNGTVLPPQS